MKRQINIRPNLKFRQYQSDAIQTAKRLIAESPEAWHLFYAPTGTGKSLFELGLLNELDTGMLITPRIEIIRDMLDKGGIQTDSVNEVVTTGQQFGIQTPVRLRNILASGKLPYRPDVLIIDESHHDPAETYQQIIMYMNYCTKVGPTATPFRGTPKQTQEFRKQWGNKIHTMITLEEASKQGFISIPVPEMWALVDDDEIAVENGEFKSRSANNYIFDRIKEVAIRSRIFYERSFGCWDMPTMYAVSTTELVHKLVSELRIAGLPAVAVTQASTKKERDNAFEMLVSCRATLVQIDVVSEGIDLPIRRLIDIKPTLSPVRWLQQIGRATRSSPDFPPQYICCCRNLERHGYLMEGMFPPTAIIESQQAFNAPSKRSGMRAIGLEGLGKFKHTPIHCLSGMTAFMYNMICVEGYKRTEYIFLVHPNSLEPLKAKREIPRNEDGTYEYKKGRWQLIENIPDLKGFASAHASTLTDKQMTWWKRDAEKFGLDPHREVTNKSFQVLPLLANLSEQFNSRVKLV